MRNISAIVPAFNEEKTVAGVVNKLLSSHLISEVICVNDGSTDATAQILSAFGDKIKFLNFADNHGKGFALAQGILAASGDIVAFFDADIHNLSDRYINLLISPVRNDQNLTGALGVGCRYKSSLYFPWIVYLTGMRAYQKRKLIPYTDNMLDKRYGIEVYLNSLFDKNEIAIVPLFGLSCAAKYSKRALIQAIKEYWQTGFEVAKQKGEIELSQYINYKDLFNKLAPLADVDTVKIRIKDIATKDIKDLF
ncbi:MAG: hypothetical protein A3B75_02475 [Candidatus Terrybacteria bacterium RIFCSPHIGHO2_02_FULL_43_14]|nr:MAG: hypothetical protein A3B75_02475 [Candidatus Terrybacteria bacterium RIFCSPHIGHO2_02_FULL_43_14]